MKVFIEVYIDNRSVFVIVYLDDADCVTHYALAQLTLATLVDTTQIGSFHLVLHRPMLSRRVQYTEIYGTAFSLSPAVSQKKLFTSLYISAEEAVFTQAIMLVLEN